MSTDRGKRQTRWLISNDCLLSGLEELPHLFSKDPAWNKVSGGNLVYVILLKRKLYVESSRKSMFFFCFWNVYGTLWYDLYWQYPFPYVFLNLSGIFSLIYYEKQKFWKSIFFHFIFIELSTIAWKSLFLYVTYHMQFIFQSSYKFRVSQGFLLHLEI